MSLDKILKLSWNDKSAFTSVMENAFSPDTFFKKLFILETAISHREHRDHSGKTIDYTFSLVHHLGEE